MVPVSSYDRQTGRLRLGQGAKKGRERRNERNAEARANIALTPAVPMALKLAFGAGEADVKLGGLAMQVGGFDFHLRDTPPTSAELAEAWRPYVETCIEAFGAARCMFESNFPVDKGGYGYSVGWNAFKRLAAGASAEEKADLFWRSAARFYRLPGVEPS